MVRDYKAAEDEDVKVWLDWMNTYYPDGDIGESFNVYSYAVAYSLVQVLEKLAAQVDE